MITHRIGPNWTDSVGGSESIFTNPMVGVLYEYAAASSLLKVHC